jgi:hypothetical protein
MSQDIHTASNGAISRALPKMKKLNLADLKVIRQALDDVYLEMVENLATPAELASVIIPLIKIDSLIKKENNK